MHEWRVVDIEWKRWDRREGRVSRCFLSVHVAGREAPHAPEHRYRVNVEIAGGAMAARVTHWRLGSEAYPIWLPCRTAKPAVAEAVVAALQPRVKHLMAAEPT
jgi:hypothetical protein